MTENERTTLAYSKSPKASKRTTFQDELQTAVSARASRWNTHRDSSPDDCDEKDNDKLLKSRKKRVDAFKSTRSKAQMNEFDLSDDEGGGGVRKRVSFVKSQRVARTSLGTPPDGRGSGRPPASLGGGSQDEGHSPPSRPGTGFNDADTETSASERSAADPARPPSSREPSRETASPSDAGVVESPRPRGDSGDGGGRNHSQNDFVPPGGGEREPPRPKPRQRTLGLTFRAGGDHAGDADSSLSHALTSSVSIPLSAETTDTRTAGSLSPDRFTAKDFGDIGPEEDHVVPNNLSQSFSSSRSEQPHSLTKSTVNSEMRDDLNSDNTDSKAHEKKYSTSFEEFQENSEEHADSAGLGQVSDKSLDTSSTSKGFLRSQSACSSKVETKYMGTLKVLDLKVSLKESQLEGGDSLRAVVYQEWLRKKKKKLRENLQEKKKEELLKEEKKKMDEASKRENAVASFEAWKGKKTETLKEKAKEKQAMIVKQEREFEERKEKVESAKKVFEKWKKEHDEQLKEKHRKQRETENKHNQKKQENEVERKINSKYAFSDWCETKKDIIEERFTTERKKTQMKAEEEREKREERDKMALETYESWLRRKTREQRRQREERQIQTILQDSPPPPWSPPNKTVPFGK